LYDSSRFNDDGDDIATTSSTVPEDHAAEDASRSKDLKVFTARNVKVKTAEFLKSSVTVKDCPPPVYPEFAVIGRSNVGKSSLINLITGRNSLAMVSKTPGKTKCINHFLINGSWYLVDLPGYGYARVSKENVAGWSKFTREYFLERENLAAVLVLVDASIPPMQLDIECASWLAEAEVPFVLVYTKLDKRKKGVPPARENIAAFEAALLERYEVLPPAVATSSRTGKGKGELLALIGQMRSAYNSQKV
jgi:GTP-binding protein